jgi:hypothetical protein
VINYKGGHQVEIEIKDISDGDVKNHKFSFMQKHFKNIGGG